MRVFAATDIGKARDMNQDYYYISPIEEELKLYILADGMGGYAGGEIASKMAIEAVKTYIEKNWENINKNDDSIFKLLKDATNFANSLVHQKALETPKLKEMGTTLEICIIYNEQIYISHIGDSRIYTISGDKIEAKTVDHTYVEKLIKEGTISREEAKNHPDRHMLMRALGCNDIVEPDIFKINWEQNESILICSDGITNMIKDEEIKEIVINEIIIPEKVLIKKANEYGGLDNITVILIKH